MGDDLISLAVFELDCPAPPAGWTAELDRRGVVVAVDDIGRPSIPRAVARLLLEEHREQEARKARHRQEVERRAIAADEARRAALPKGIPAGAVPEGISAGQLMMLSDPMQGSRRESVLEHALANPDGALIFHPINEDAS